jgi:hypothetical protein
VTSAAVHVHSALQVTGGRAHLVANGQSIAEAAPGALDTTVASTKGENLLELVVSETHGGGRWLVQIDGPGVRPGTVRIVAGVGVPAGPGTVVFELSGAPGERAAVAFSPEPSP